MTQDTSPMQLFAEYEYQIANDANPEWCRITREAAAQVVGPRRLWELEQVADGEGGAVETIEQHGTRKDTGERWRTSHTLVVTRRQLSLLAR